MEQGGGGGGGGDTSNSIGRSAQKFRSDGDA